MAVIKKFDFGNSFGEDDGIADSAGGAPSARDAKIEEAYNNGREAGLAEARASTEQQLAAAAATIAQQLEALESTRSGIEQTMSAQALQLSAAVVGKILPSLIQREAMSEIEKLISDCLARVHDEPRIVIRVPDAFLDPLKGRIDELVRASAYEGQVVLLADDGLGPTACHVEWADGGAKRDMEAIWREVDETIQRAFTTTGDGEVQPDANTAPAETNITNQT